MRMNKKVDNLTPRPLSRRSFLKATSIAAGTAALSFSPGQPVLRALTLRDKEEQAAKQEEKIFQSCCFNNCQSHCRHNVHVRDGKVVKISQASFPDDRYNRICLRGLCHPQRIYSQDRLKYPLKRAGKRGSNKWERITWDEAIHIISEKFSATQKKYGKTALGFHTASGDFGTLNGVWPGSISLLAKELGATHIEQCVDAGFIPGINRVCGPWPGAWNRNEHADVANSKNIYAWASNMTLSSPHQWHFLADAIEKGARLTVFDPNFTGLAAKAHRHVSMRPGTDIALLMTMIQVIISEKIYDNDFVVTHTCAPLLVREDTGNYLRMSDLENIPGEGRVNHLTDLPGSIDPHLVWDAEIGKAVQAGTCSKPSLQGTYTVKGIKVRTAFDLLTDKVAPFTLKKGFEITDVMPDVIQSVARDFANIKPGTSILGYGSQAYDNGPAWGHAIATLHALTGQIGRSGSFVALDWFAYLGVNFSLKPKDKIPMLYLPELLKTGQVEGEKRPRIKALWVSHANPVTAWAEQNFWLNEFWPTLDFVVVADEQLTDTARFADLILPTAHWYEREDILPLGGSHPFIQYAEKVIDPLYESMPDVDIHRLIANKMGVGEKFSASNDEMLKMCFETPYFAERGFTVENIKKKKVIRFQPQGYIAWEDKKFTTSSGRMEFYCDNPLDLFDKPVPGNLIEANRLPEWIPPREVRQDNPLLKKYPLVLMSQRPGYRVNTQWYNTEWLRELDLEPTIFINPDDAKVRKIKEGDYVEIFNDRGIAVAKAVISGGIRKGIISYPKGWQRHQHKAGSFSELDTKAFDRVGVNQSFFDVLAEVRKWEGQV